MRPGARVLWPLLAMTATIVLAALTVVAWTSDAGYQEHATGAPTGPRAADIFRAKGCAGCHQAPGVATQTGVGPDLTGLAARAGDRVPGLSPEQYVRRSVLDPSAYLVDGYSGDGVRMPTLPVSSAELDALVLFLLAGRP